MSGPEFFQTVGGQRFIAQITKILKDQAEATANLAKVLNAETTEQFMAHTRHHLAKEHEVSNRIAEALERIAKALESK